MGAPLLGPDKSLYYVISLQVGVWYSTLGDFNNR